MPAKIQHASPLRYPGSKALLTDYIQRFIIDNDLVGSTIVEPYAGSAIISLQMLTLGSCANAIIVERDPLIYAFWECVFHYTDELIESIQQIDISLETWNQFRRYRLVDNPYAYPIVEMGTAGLFFNRANFSGILKAGPIGGKNQNSIYKIDCRFNKDRIIRLITDISRYRNAIQVVFSDALNYLTINRANFLNGAFFIYIDPPYFVEGKNVYRYWYELQDHIALADYLSGLITPWLVSYDSHEAIRQLYTERAIIQNTYFDYAAGRRKRGLELLISNRYIPPREIQENDNLLGAAAL